MESVFLNGGMIGATLDFASEERYESAGPIYDDAITGSSGGTPDFRWKFNNSTAEEGSHSTTVYGTWAYATGLISSIDDASADLNGSNTYLVPANSSLINTGTFTKRSVSFWFNADTTGSGTYPCIWEEGGGVNWFSIYFDNGLIYANIGENSSTQGHATASVSTGTTYHCLVTVDLTLGSDNIKIYLNGSLAGQATTSAGTDLAAHSGDNRIGSGSARNHLNSNITYATYDGRLQDFCYWYEDALTSTDASDIYTAGVTGAELGNLKNSGIWLLQSVYDSLYVPSVVPTQNLILHLDANNPASYPGSGTDVYDLSPEGNDGVLTNGATHNGTYFEFDGDNDYIELGTITTANPLQLSSPAGGGMSVSFAVWHDGTGDNYQRIIDKSNNSSAANGWAMYRDISGSPVDELIFYSPSPGILDSNTSPVNNTWEIWTFTHNSSTNAWAFYRNGTSVQTGTTTYNIPSVQTNARIGTWNHTDARELNGRIGFIAVHEKPLDNTEVTSLFNHYKDIYGI